MESLHHQMLTHAGEDVLQGIVTDAQQGISRGIFLCTNQSIALQIAHDTYAPHATVIELRAALYTASSRRATVLIASDVPELVYIDVQLALYALDNLVTNAAKYGAKDGRITLCASLAAGQLLIETINAPDVQHSKARDKYGDTDAAEDLAATGKARHHHTSLACMPSAPLWSHLVLAVRLLS